MRYGQSVLFNVLILCSIIFIVAGLFAGMVVKIYQKAEEVEALYEKWQEQQTEQYDEEILEIISETNYNFNYPDEGRKD